MLTVLMLNHPDIKGPYPVGRQFMDHVMSQYRCQVSYQVRYPIWEQIQNQAWDGAHHLLQDALLESVGEPL